MSALKSNRFSRRQGREEKSKNRKDERRRVLEMARQFSTRWCSTDTRDDSIVKNMLRIRGGSGEPPPVEFNAV